MESGTGLPLGAYPRLRTNDPDEARAWVAKWLRPHRLWLAGTSPPDIVHNGTQPGRIGFHFMDYGAPTRVEVDVDPGDPFLVQLPLAGQSLIRIGNREVEATPDVAVIVGSEAPLAVRYSAQNPRILLRIDRAVIEARLRRMLGGTVPRSFGFEPQLRLDTAAARSWRSLVEAALNDLDTGGAIASSPLAFASLEKAIIDGLLVVQPHSYSEQLENSGTRARPRAVQRAVTLIHDHCTEPLSTADIAEAVGLSIRSLQEGFHTHLGTTPMTYLRRVRLHRIRDELRAADPATTSVSQVALDWGMTHFGRFAQAYRVEFGETPSETLRYGS